MVSNYPMCCPCADSFIQKDCKEGHAEHGLSRFLCGQLYDSLEEAAQQEARSKPAKEAAWALTVLEELRQRFSRLVGSFVPQFTLWDWRWWCT